MTIVLDMPLPETCYRAQARLLKSRWVYGIRSAPVEIVFNGVVRRRESW